MTFGPKPGAMIRVKLVLVNLNPINDTYIPVFIHLVASGARALSPRARCPSQQDSSTRSSYSTLGAVTSDCQGGITCTS